LLNRYVNIRLLQVVPTVLGILVLTFLLIHIAPGDPILALAGEYGDEAYYARMRERYQLDRPMIVQLFVYIGHVLRGDLGVSFVQGRPALGIIMERLPATLLLSGTALVVSSLLGIVLGTYAAARAHGVRDITITTGALGIYAAPVFWLGQLALLFIALRFAWVPIAGMRSPGSQATGLADMLDVARHLALPALVLASQGVAAIARLTRAGILEQMESDYILTAHAKGLKRTRILVRHALRNALLPIVTVIGGRVGHLLGGTIIIEVIFSWPGIGRLLLSSMQSRDYPIILGIFLLVAITVVIANLLTDLTYGRLDPRVRLR
jgi:peptide/nickel transport system permease protein